MNRIEITPGLVRALLHYEPESGRLYWKRRAANLFTPTAKMSAEQRCACWNTRNAGKEAFPTPHADGYRRGSILGHYFRAHQIAYVHFFRRWPDGEVDHLNGQRDDNRIANLRDVAHATNAKNLPLNSRNRSGVAGVSWSAERKKWFASIQVDGKTIPLGRHDNIGDAIAARRSAQVAHGFIVRLEAAQ